MRLARIIAIVLVPCSGAPGRRLSCGLNYTVISRD
jgi:hypothetical protein